MLSGERVLVAEDECLIAMDLADTFETAGANVVGPASTVQDALKLIMSHEVDRACLDFNLADGEVTPVLDLLASKGIPMVVYTGRGLPNELVSQHPKLTVLHKPLPAKRLVKELANAKANRPRAASEPGAPQLPTVLTQPEASPSRNSSVRG